MLVFPRHFSYHPLRGTSNPINEKSPYLLKVDAQFCMEIDRKHMFVIKTFISKLYVF